MFSPLLQHIAPPDPIAESTYNWAKEQKGEETFDLLLELDRSLVFASPDKALFLPLDRKTPMIKWRLNSKKKLRMNDLYRDGALIGDWRLYGKDMKVWREGSQALECNDVTVLCAPF